jgi:2-iminoacetate synthase
MSFHALWSRHDFAGTGNRIRASTTRDVRRALGRAGGALSLDDLAALLSPAARPHLEEMARWSHRLTAGRFGRTMRLYAPLYLTNICANVCTYCGFSRQNRIPRKALADGEIAAEARILRGFGFDQVLLVTGESASHGPGYLRRALRLLRPEFAGLALEVQPLETAEYASLMEEGASAVHVYQETYDPAAYARHHLAGPKGDIVRRLETPDRLGRAGMKKIGLGALFGLGDWRAEAWFVGLHLRYLQQAYWRSRYSVSFPRLRPHAGQGLPLVPFDERDLVQTACALRLFDRDTELALSTRERAAFRDRAVPLGFTSMSAGSRTSPGGYGSAPGTLEQFEVDDDRSPAEVAAMLRRQGWEPVWKDWDRAFDGGAASEAAAAVAPCRSPARAQRFS